MPPRDLAYNASPLQSPTSLDIYYDAFNELPKIGHHAFDPSEIFGSEDEDLSTGVAKEATIVDTPPRTTGPSLSLERSDYGDNFGVSENGIPPFCNSQALHSTAFGQPATAVQVSQLMMPKSKYFGYTPPLPPSNEKTAVLELIKRVGASGSKDFVEFELSEFAIYLPGKIHHHPFQMRGLQFLTTKTGHGYFLFDGILTCGKERHYVQEVPFKVCSIGNYGEDLHMVGSQIWIQSDLNSKANIYYRLGSPSTEYRRFHEGFLWVANLGKHFVDFCEAHHSPVSVYSFQSEFSTWIKSKHWESKEFQIWYNGLGSDDFPRAVAVNIEFLFKESTGVNSNLRSLPIWNELLWMNSVPKQAIVESQTIVTPFVYECFKHMRFGHHLKAVQPSQVSESQQVMQENALNLNNNHDFQSRMPNSPSLARLSQIVKTTASIEVPDASESKSMHERRIQAIGIGDVLSVTKDGEDSVWKDEASRWKAADADDCWYVYVQGVHVGPDGKRSFDALWLYKPSDTSCAKMKYPFPNELFLSDNCTCSKSRITHEEVLDIVPLKWYCHPANSGNQFFIRQTYLKNEKFVTLRESHKVCEHLEPSVTAPSFRVRYPIGQTVLAPPKRKTKHQLEVYEVDQYILEGTKEFVMLRRLMRRNSIDGKGKPNELVYTNNLEKRSTHEIYSKSLVRFFTQSEVTSKKVPAPYCRDGTANSFYITSELAESDGVQSIKAFSQGFPQSLIQGFNPSDLPSRRLLRGMDLYCGGGNLGRGLEEGGAVENEWAVDLDQHAMHTYAANLKPAAKTKLWYGSVNDLLSQALQGNPNNSKLIPRPGDVDLVEAGSPCQGFSTLNDTRNDERGLKNQSMVASVAAYIDFYRPKYGLLENVMAMAQRGLGRDEDVLSQLICAIVGMGYQLQIFVLDAWSCGGPQSRTRLFVSFAAPGVEPLEHPALSHSHPNCVTNRGIGKLANGEPFGRRIRGPTAFEFVNAEEAIKDLPRIGDGITYHCIEQPDHVVTRQITRKLRNQIELIPIRPWGMTFSKAWEKGLLTEEQREVFLSDLNKPLPENVRSGSRAWGRVNPQRLFALISQSIHPADARNGPTIHWSEQRILTLMEGRRIQGFPDNEVMPGTPMQGWKRLGNSVSRQVSLTLGLSLREAWLKNEPEDKYLPKKPDITSPLRAGTLQDDAAKETNSGRINLAVEFESKKARKQPVAASKVHQSIDLPVARSPVPRPDSKASSSTSDIQNRAKSVARIPILEIPDSDGSSDDEDTLQSSLKSIPIQKSITQHEKPPRSRGAVKINEGRRTIRKRRYSTTSESQTSTSKSRKIERTKTPVQISRREPKLAMPPGRTAQVIPSSATSNQKRAQMGISRAGIVDSDADSDLESVSVSQSPQQARTIQTTSKGQARLPPSTASSSTPAPKVQPRSKSKSKPKRKALLLLSLISSEEDDGEEDTEAETTKLSPQNASDATPPESHKSAYNVTLPKPTADGDTATNHIPMRRPHELGLIRPPPAPQQPVDNSDFVACERTYKYLGHDKNRKSGPMSRG